MVRKVGILADSEIDEYVTTTFRYICSKINPEIDIWTSIEGIGVGFWKDFGYSPFLSIWRVKSHNLFGLVEFLPPLLRVSLREFGEFWGWGDFLPPLLRASLLDFGEFLGSEGFDFLPPLLRTLLLDFGEFLGSEGFDFLPPLLRASLWETGWFLFKFFNLFICRERKQRINRGIMGTKLLYSEYFGFYWKGKIFKLYI